MPYDISEIKKLSNQEKLQLIDELWESIDADAVNAEDTFDEEPEVASLLQERIQKYERGEGASYTWEEAKRILLDNMGKRQNEK